MPDLNRLSDLIVTVTDLFTPEECDGYIALAEGIGFGEAPVSTAGGPVLIPSVRNNERDEPQRPADDVVRRESVGANHHAEGRELRARHPQPVALRVQVVCDVQFVELAVLQQQLSARRDQHGGVVDVVPVPLRQPRTDIHAGSVAARRSASNASPPGTCDAHSLADGCVHPQSIASGSTTTPAPPSAARPINRAARRRLPPTSPGSTYIWMRPRRNMISACR
jgi:hypothetical protein